MTYDEIYAKLQDGTYKLDGSLVVTAEAVRTGDKWFTPFYVLEVYENGIWTRTASGFGSSCSVTGSAVPMRLTWKWSLIKGSRFIIR